MIEIEQQKNHKYKLNVKTEGGQVLLTSKAIKARDKLEKIATLLKSSEQTALIFERKTNHQGKFLFSVKDSNGQLLGMSESYTSEAGMENGIKNLKIHLANL